MKIMGELVLLRDEKGPSDEADLFRWLNLEEWNYYDEPDAAFTPISREAYEASLKKPRAPTPGCHTWQVDTLDGHHIGWVNYYQLDEKARIAYIGICLPEPDTWGKGYGTAALNLLVQYLLDELHLEEIRADTWTRNLRMRHLAKKCGFKEIGRSPHRTPISVRGEPLEFIHFNLVREKNQSPGL